MTNNASTSMDDILGVCKRRGFIFPSSEIYNGINGFFDYGPLGVELKENIRRSWWKEFVHCREDVTGIDSSIISSPAVWRASGHVEGFSDPMTDCKTSKLRFRADQLMFAKVEVKEARWVEYICMVEPEFDKEEVFFKAALELKRKAGVQGELSPLKIKEFVEATDEEVSLIPSPISGVAGDLTPPKEFNLMFQTKVGASDDSSSIAYLRPETAQGIFLNYKNVKDTSRVKIPFGIAQIGKAFRNEITPRNYIFRSREFEQMEIEYFINPDADWKEIHHQWITDMKSWLLSIGINDQLLFIEKHAESKLAHYARACTDITFKFPFGIQELMGVAARGNYDLSAHQAASGRNLEYFDPMTKEKYLPHVIEPSLGLDRLFLALITSAYCEDEIEGETRKLLKFHPSVAPVKVAVLPLVKNKPELVAYAQRIHSNLQKRYNTFWDATGAIGRRYRRMDEIGTPFCITIDFETLENHTVTLRHRDSTLQERVHINDVVSLLSREIDGFGDISS